jgi:hypothetical protein
LPPACRPVRRRFKGNPIAALNPNKDVILDTDGSRAVQDRKALNAVLRFAMPGVIVITATNDYVDHKVRLASLLRGPARRAPPPACFA